MPSNDRATIFAAIEKEREYQDKKFGDITGGGGHTPGGWALIAEFELAEAKEAMIKGGTGRNTWRAELVQLAAVCIAALEQHGVDEPPLLKREV